VQLISRDRVVDLGPPKQRLAFAALVIDAGRPVTVATLVERVWGEDHRVDARNALYAHIMRIRRVLDEVRRAGDTPAALVRGPAGYTLDIDPEQVDLHRFRRLARQSRQPDCGDGERVLLLRRALELRRGVPLTDLGGQWVNRIREGCRQEHVDLAVAWAQAELRVGNHGAVLARVGELVHDYPLVEPLIEALIRALRAAGRTAEALDCYATARRRLAEELGVEPTAELQQLHVLLLRGDPDPVRVADPPEAAGGPLGPICQLPPDVVDFTGRSAQSRQIVELLVDQATPVVVLSGPPGVGKSALALHIAHQIRQRFPDGQLFVSLAGASTQPRVPSDVLGDLLRVLGVDPGSIPDRLDQRAALWRARLADRRILVVVDDAAGPAQIRPLRPGTAGCAMLVTSRNQLAGLDAAALVAVDCLSRDDAIQLLGRIAGSRRMTEARPAVEDLVAACGRLPLALRIVGAKLAARPSWPVERLARLISDERYRLDELTLDDLAVRSSIALSYHTLDRRSRRLFRRLALLGPHDFPEWVAGALLGEEDARDLVALLADKSLIAATGTDATGEPRYRLHDLLRDYAAERLADEPPPSQDAAVTRLLSGYLELSYQADRHVVREEFLPRPEPVAGPRLIPAELAIRLTEDPPAWFDAERLPLIAATTRACAVGRLALAVRLADHQFANQDRQGRYDDSDRLWRTILDAADLAGDPQVLAGVRSHHGLMAVYRRYSADALALIDRAAAGYLRAGDTVHLAYCLASRAFCAASLGRFERARPDAIEGLAYARQSGDVPAQAWNLQILGTALAHLGKHEDSHRYCREGLELTRQNGDPLGEYRAMANLAGVLLLSGDAGSAIKHARAAIESATEAQRPCGIAYSSLVLADAYHALGRHQETVKALGTVLPAFDGSRSRPGRAKTLLKLGRAHHELGHAHQATRYLTEGVAIFRELQLDTWQARARHLLARTAFS
jgi:DNA-binding SARP family transcriptional activator/tetratricopeptide (TPR) repeat protein